MDIHRCRFVPYPPSAINAVAFSLPSALSNRKKGLPSLRLAIGRANGDIEIWNPLKGIWLQETILRGGKDRSIEGLVWTRDPEDFTELGQKIQGKLRLFSIGYSTAVTEWDFVLGRPLRVSAGNYGELWCIAAQPKSEQVSSRDQDLLSGAARPQEQNIVVGCADGAIVVLSTSDCELRFLKTLARPSKKKARVLSITYQNRNTVISGHADSTIRVFDARNGQQIRSLSLGAGPQGGPKETLVWSVKCSPDGTIVSGDSTGTLRFWDGKNYTLLQRIKSHMADILDVAVTADGETVISGGMDRRTTVYRRVGSGKRGDRSHWAEVAHRRLHKHDVKAMTTFETRKLSVLVSGGLDTNPIITPIQQFGKENHRMISGLPLQPCVGGASGERLMMSWWASEISIWWIPVHDQAPHSAGEENGDLDRGQTRKLAAKIVIQGEESLVSADLTSDARMLAACTMSTVKLFRLQRKGEKLLVSKTDTPVNIGESGARMVKFSPDGKWLILIRPDSKIQICRLIQDRGPREGLLLMPKIMILERFSRDPTETQSENGLGNYVRSIGRVAFSADSRIIAVADLAGYLDTWVLRGREDLAQDANEDVRVAEPSAGSDDEGADEEIPPQLILGQHWLLNPYGSLIPRLSATALILSFRPQYPKKTTENKALHHKRETSHSHSQDLPDGEDRLFVLTSEHQMHEFHVLSGRLSDWSRRNPSSKLPRSFQKVRDRAMGSIWNINGSKQRIWLYGSSWLWMFDLSFDLPAGAEPTIQAGDDQIPPNMHAAKNLKRKRSLDGSNVEEIKKRDTGAGDKISESNLFVGVGRKYRKTDGPEAGNGQWISVNSEQSPAPHDANFADDDDADDDHVANESALFCLRRRSAETVRITNGSNGDHFDEASGTVQLGRRVPHNNRSYWGTHRYRDILGIVPLGNGVEYGDESQRGVEVALVERPLFEVDLPPRYHGNQEWD